MFENRHHPMSRAVRYRWAALAFAGLIAVAVVGFRPALQRHAEDRVLIRRSVEAPRLDTGVSQPVLLNFTGERQPAVGQAAALKLVVTSGATGASIRARIVPPRAATISSGRSAWDGELSYQQVAEIPVGVTFAGEKGGFVYGEAVTTLPDGRVFRTATSVYVDPGPPDTPPPEPKTLIEPDGSRLDVVVWKNR